MIDTLIEKIKQTKNPTAVGLDTSLDYLPEAERAHVSSLSDAAKAITAYNYALIDALHMLVPAVKVQVAYYESYGVCGMQAFADTLSYAHQKGLITIADV
ncbi:MAG: orotidine 5'-phosphate decarboxylase, partial [Clostridiales bacterium]|nr:orotidine 5'-phosphate decarboxylase [Clostridiales bacterium]